MHERPGEPLRSLRSAFALWRRLVHLCALAAGIAGSPLAAAEHHAPLDGPKTEWVVSADNSGRRPTVQEHVVVQGDYAREGTGAEFLRLASAAPGGSFELVCPTPPILRIDETRATLWVRSSQPALAIYVRLRFPNQVDPRTERPLVAEIPGGRYEVTNSQWKQLECRPDDRSFQQLMQRLRHQLIPQLRQQSDLDTRDVYVEAVVIRGRLDSGETDLMFDDLRVAPLVPLQGSQAVPAGGERSGDGTGSFASGETGRFSRIRIGDNRVTKDGKPFVPLFVPYHHETIEQFMETGANVAWVERYDDEMLLKEFAAKGLGVTTTPPRLPPGEAEAGSSLPPFTAATAPIDFWMLDVRIPGSALPEVRDWVEQVRDADQQHPRPILADVVGREREFHRELSLLGSSRFVLGSMDSPLDLADHLARKQRTSLPGKGMFTIVPLEPADGQPHDPADGPRIEPEQIFLLGNSALSAGCKAIGYWNRNPLCDETRHALKLMNLQIRLLEPWLATGKVVGTAPIQFGPDRGAEGKGTKLPTSFTSRWDDAQRKPPGGRAAQLEREIRATVIDSEFGMLVVINWLEANGQFQPGQMQVDDLHLFVKRDVQMAWTVTTTKIEPVTALKPVSGGTEITLKKLDQFSYILITHDRSTYDAVARQIQQIRQTAAESWIELAALKLRRVHEVHRQIEFQAPAVPDAAARLSNADQFLAEARKSLSHGSCNGAQEYSRAVLALTRGVQRRHWENAVARFSSPVANPYAVAFQTLPRHWKMLEQLGSGPPKTQTLLAMQANGGFRSLEQMADDGWTRRDAELPETIRTAVELRPAAGGGLPTDRSCLRLAAGTGADSPQYVPIEGALIQLQSPVLVAQPGQYIHVTGKVRIPQSIDPAGDGLVIYNTLDGAVRGLRFRQPTQGGQWQTFELMSQATDAREFAIVFELRGLGDVLLDDLRVVAIDPDEATPEKP